MMSFTAFRHNRRRGRAALGCVILLMLSASIQAAPRVVASIKPIDSLVAAVMAGTHNAPYLLVPGAASPHTYSLRPSDMAALDTAQVVFWVGPLLETFLSHPLANLPANVLIVPLYRAPGVRLLPVRVGFGPIQHKNAIGHALPLGATRDAAGINPHIWLDPRNAEAMVREIARVLSQTDPSNARRYAMNATALEIRLRGLDRHLANLLKPVKNVPFMVFHDAYIYLDTRYDLRAVGALTVEPSLPPGAQRLAAARKAIRRFKVRCLFREPEFTSPLIRTVTAGSNVRIGVLDPLGANLQPGPDLYFQLMRNLGTHLETCLAQ